jgi:hypothetical protein
MQIRHKETTAATTTKHPASHILARVPKCPIWTPSAPPYLPNSHRRRGCPAGSLALRAVSTAIGM